MRRGLVENCIFLAIECFHRWGTFGNSSGAKRSLSWNSSVYGAQMGKLDYTVANGENGQVIRFPRQFARLYGAAKLTEECTIPITSTPCRFGGERLWFRCPFLRDGKVCGKRVGRLYLPQGQTMFGCRTCHNLIHRSAREHNQRQDELARDPVALAEALGDKKLARRVAALGALVRRLDLERKRLPAQVRG